MSSVPADIAGIGATSQKLRVTPGFDALRSGLGPEEYFVLSRIDGSQTVREVLLATGLPVDRGVAILARLRSLGALLLPHEHAPPGAPGSRPTQPPPRSTAMTRPPGTFPVGPAQPRAQTSPVVAPPPSQPLPRPPTNQPAPRPLAARAPTAPVVAAAPAYTIELPNPTSDELTALAEDVELGPDDRRRILALRRVVDKQDPHMMLGVSQGADAKQLKRAYFQLSKDIHPDSYYGKRLGSFTERMASVFDAVSRAYAQLTSTSAGSTASGSSKAQPQQPQTPQEYAAEVFDRACQIEVGGDALGAMKLFAAAVRIDSQTRYLRRAATCALAAGQPKSALEYAKKAQLQTPNDPSSARLLASAFRAVGKLADAEDLLVMAMAMKTENDALMMELRYDLAEVRRLIGAADAR